MESENDKQFNEIEACEYKSHNIDISHVEARCKFIKYICPCGKDDYLKCHLTDEILLYHVFSSIGEFYDIHVKEDNEHVCEHSSKLFVCVLCKSGLEFNNGSFEYKIINHMRSHFSPAKMIRVIYTRSFSIDYTVFELFCIWEENSDLHISDLECKSEELVEKYNEGLDKLVSIQCIICDKSYISGDTYEILAHVRVCADDFMKNAGSLWVEDEYLKTAVW